jgi:hypothetical protein
MKSGRNIASLTNIGTKHAWSVQSQISQTFLSPFLYKGRIEHGLGLGVVVESEKEREGKREEIPSHILQCIV